MPQPTADSSAASSLEFTPLDDRDEAKVRAWLKVFLIDHLRHWGTSLHRDTAPEALQTEMERRDLLSREWNELHDAARDPGKLVCVARANSVPVGLVYAESRPDRYLGEPIGVLSWVYVTPDRRRQGIGKHLLARARAWFIDQKMSAAEVFVSHGNEAAHRLYESSHWHATDARLMSNLVANGPNESPVCTSLVR